MMILKHYFFIIGFAGLIFSISGCSNALYLPHSQNVPLFTERGQGQAVFSYNSVQLAGAVTDNFSVMVNSNFNFNSQSKEPDQNNIKREFESRRINLEAALGYYKKLSGPGAYLTFFGEDVAFEVYGGAGYGISTYNMNMLIADLPIRANEYKATTFNFFLQPNIGFSKDNFSLAFSTRLTGLKYSKEVIANYNPDELVIEQLDQLTQSNYLFMEPSLTIGVGIKKVKLQLQAIYSNKMSDVPMNNANLLLNLGLQVRMPGPVQE